MNKNMTPRPSFQNNFVLWRFGVAHFANIFKIAHLD